MRWADEEKDAVFANTHLRSSPGIGIISPEVAPTSLEGEEDNFDGSINLQWDLSDSAMLYGSWARGAAILNLAVFRTEIDNFQVVRFTGLGFDTTTIPVESEGLELESQWAASADLTLAASVTYTDASEKNTGDAMPGSPDWSGSITAHYEHELGLALLPVGDNWEVALLGRNLLNEEVSFEFDYPIFGGNDGSTTVASLNRPRTIALQGRYNF